MSSSTSQTSSSYSKRRHPSHSEPPPVTYHDDRAPSARLNRAIQSSNIHLVRRLLDNAHNPNGTRLDPRNPDPVTKKTSLILATEIADLAICRLLIQEYGVESETISRDLDNNTVIHLAAAEGLDDIISLYHSHYPFVLDWANSDGMTALHIASQKGHESTVSLLLDLQADVELTDNEGNTSLHYASGWGHLKIVLLLIGRGSPFWAKNNQTFTASDYAFSFSIQSALQESARAHFESKKSQQRQNRQQRDREGERTQRTMANPPSSSLRSGSPSSSRPSRLKVEESIGSAPSRSTSMPQVITPVNKPTNSPINITSTPYASKRATPLTTLTQPPPTITEPAPSPVFSVTTARMVSHLMSKDLEAIQDFRIRSGSLASTNGGANSPISMTYSHHSLESPTMNNIQSSSSNRLLPLQLVSHSSNPNNGNINNNSSKKNVPPSLRLRSSTGNLNDQSMTDVRNRAGSTDSETGMNLLSGGGREGLSRLKYLRSNNNGSSSSLNSTHRINNNNNNNNDNNNGGMMMMMSTSGDLNEIEIQPSFKRLAVVSNNNNNNGYQRNINRLNFGGNEMGENHSN